LHRWRAETHEYIRIGELDLPQRKRQADRAFLGGRRAITRWPPRNNVGDVGRSAVEPDGGQHAVQKLARAADEWKRLQVLLASRRFAHEHHAGLRIAVGKNQLGRRAAKGAALESFENRPHLLL